MVYSRQTGILLRAQPLGHRKLVETGSEPSSVIPSLGEGKQFKKKSRDYQAL